MFVLTILYASLLVGGEPRAPTQPVRLFNGRDLAGWTTWLVDSREKDPRGVYSVHDGVLRISGDGFGYLATEHPWRDYRLVVEFRWGKQQHEKRRRNARDSGIFLHAVGPDGNSYDGHGAYKAAIECQVMQGAVGDLLLIKGRDERGQDVPVEITGRVRNKSDRDGWHWWDPRGESLRTKRTGRRNWLDKDADWKDALDFRGRRDVESPRDEWTRVECVCRGESLAVSVNGKLVNQATKVCPAAGQILLQCEGSEVFFRRVELFPLNEK